MSTGPDLFVVCKNCGSEVSPYITECPYCGTRLRKRAPKLDREGRPSERLKRSRRAPRPTLGRLRQGEMPGIRPDSRPYATAALVLAAIGATVAWRAGAFGLGEIAVNGPLDGDWWRLLTAPFAYDNMGHELVALTAVALFGWLLERRRGPLAVLAVALLGGAAGMGLAAIAEPYPLAFGGHGMGLALLAAWALPDLLALRRGEEVESDLLGVAVFAAVLALVPLAVEGANALAGIGGAIAGLVLGVPLMWLGHDD